MNLSLNNIDRYELAIAIKKFNFSNEQMLKMIKNNTILITNDDMCYLFNCIDNEYLVSCIDISKYFNFINLSKTYKYDDLSTFNDESLAWTDTYKKMILKGLSEAEDNEVLRNELKKQIKCLSNVSDIIIDKNNKKFSIVNNSLYDLTLNQIILITTNSIIDLKYSYSLYCFSMINKDVPIIYDTQFYYYFFNNSLKNIQIPDNATVIQGSTFSNCSNLIQVDFGNSKINKIENSAFSGTKIQNINIPTTLSEIDFYSFECCDLRNLIIPSNIHKIKSLAFSDNYNLKEIKIYSTIISIEDEAFYNNTSLEKVIFKRLVEYKLILRAAIFYECINLKYVIFEQGVADSILESFDINEYIIKWNFVIPDDQYNRILNSKNEKIKELIDQKIIIKMSEII